MSPHCLEMGQPEASGSTDGAAGLETAAPDTGTPTPSPTPSGTPSPPPPPPQGVAEEAVGQDDNQNRIAVNPAPVLQNEAPDCLPVDHNLSHLLRQVSGNADLVSVRDIKLRLISKEMSLQRLALFVPNLRELNLDGSYLGSLRDLGCGLMSLNKLKVSRCGLQSLDGTFGLTSLRELHAGNNMVDDIGPCSCLPHIRIIDLCRNAVDDVSFLEFLNICHHLEELTLAGCPASFKAGYRATVRRLLPNLITLDGIPVAQGGTEHDVVNDDDDDDDDDDNNEDEDSDDSAVGGYPDRVSSTPGSRRDTVRRLLDSHRGGHEDGSGSSGLQRPNVTDHDQEKDGVATSLGISSASNERDSPDCSTPAHHIYTSLTSTQGTSSDSTLVQNRQKHPRRATAMKRPATAVAVADASLNNPHCQLRRRRSFSAATTTDEGDVSDTCVPDPRLDSPSALTSGMVVCGNLTAALRSRRKRHDAWTEEDIPSALEPRKYIPETEVKQPCESIVSAEEGIGLSPETWREETEKTTSELLEESKGWRNFYAAYRSEKRLLWEEEEDDEEEEKLNEVATETRNMKREEQNKSADVFKKFQSKAPPCCPHLFMHQKPRLDVSYDADRS